MSDHPTKKICHQDISAEIDEELAPLILGLWKLDIKTESSCQFTGFIDPDGRRKRLSYIQMTDQDALKFSKLVIDAFMEVKFTS